MSTNVGATLCSRALRILLSVLVASWISFGPFVRHRLLAQGAEDNGARDAEAAQQSDESSPAIEHVMAEPQSMESMHHGGANMGSYSLIHQITQHEASGTSVEPGSTPAPMLMAMKHGWMFMFHGVAFLNLIQQSGPRGADKLFSTNWLMPMAQRRAGPGTLTLRAMLSLEPASVTGRKYPELFQVGETAFGRPIVDGQHPHDFFMELAALYDMRMGGSGLLSLYAAPVGDPALGPIAYPHRASASENPLATLGHHIEDSTHIADNVVTLGIACKWVRLEASGFHGREPDEHRWDIDGGGIDSWSSRLTISPARNWSAQYSVGRLKSPEEQHPNENLVRMTASVTYNRPFANSNWATTLLWGRNRTQSEGEISNGYLAESTLFFKKRNYIWGRAESVDRTNELLLGGSPEPPGFEERFLARVQAYTFGYDRELRVLPKLATALGGQVTFYGVPDSLASAYGSHPKGAALFLRIRPQGGHP